MSRANNFVERMQAGKDAAAHARHRGRACGGKPAKPSHWRQLSGFEYEHQRNRAQWQSARIDACEQYRFDVFGHEWEGL